MTREDSLLVQIQVKKPILVDVTNQLLEREKERETTFGIKSLNRSLRDY